MKRKIAMLLVGLMCVSATGCSFGKQNNDIEKISATNIFADISEDAVVDGSTAASDFTKALTNAEKLENVTINVILDGILLRENLEKTGNNINWLEKNLKKQGIADIKNVFLATCDNQNNLSVYVKLDKQNKHGFFE